jgi:hypothetical protein
MPETSRKDFGEFRVALQPDYTYSHNGYGLLMLNANFARKASDSAKSNVIFGRGERFPAETDGGSSGTQLSDALKIESWTCVKAEESGRDGNVMYVKAQYAAIALIMGGQQTETECTITSSAVSEGIETHPNFSIIQMAGLSTKPLGGELDATGPPLSVASTETRNPFRAKWTVNQVQGVTQYQFLGFLPAQKAGENFNRKAGVKSYFRPSITMKLTGYTTNAFAASYVASKVGFWTYDGVGFLKIPEVYLGIAEGSVQDVTLKGDLAGKKPSWLVTSSNMEVFGGLYKVTVDMMLSGVAGWDEDIYRKTSKT